MFIPMVMVIEMSKMADKLVAVWAKYSSEPEKSSWVVSKNGMVKKLWSYCSWVTEGRNIKKPCSISQKITCIFKGWHLVNGSSKSNNPWHFLKELRSFAFEELQPWIPLPPPLCLIWWSVKYTFTCQRWDFKLVNKDVLFLQKRR